MDACKFKGLNALINNKRFFDHPVKKTRSIWKTYRNVKNIKIIQEKIYYIICIIKIIMNLLALIYQDKKIWIFINKLILQKKFREDNGVAIFFIAEKQEKTILNFSLDSLIVTE